MENINLFNIMLVSHHMVNQITMRTWEGNIFFYSVRYLITNLRSKYKISTFQGEYYHERQVFLLTI